MIPFLKKNKDGKKPPKSTVPRTAQQSIPMTAPAVSVPATTPAPSSIRTSIISLPSRRIRLPFSRNGAVF